MNVSVLDQTCLTPGQAADLRGLRQSGGKLLCSETVTGMSRTGGLWHVQAGDIEIMATVLANSEGAWADRINAGVGNFFWLVGQSGYCIMVAPALAEATLALICSGSLPRALSDAGIDARDLAPGRLADTLRPISAR
jgi:glycine/D-amino acid oxidase-like deaminating enzyme